MTPSFKTTLKSVFKNGSTTYFYSSLFFSAEVWEEVATLYAYVRTLDDFVDQVPADTERFQLAVAATESLWQTISSDTELTETELETYAHTSKCDLKTITIIAHFIVLARKKNFSYDWIQAFLEAMSSDLKPKKYQSYSQLTRYMYGSASVIGLCMCAILGIPKKAYPAAEKQGEAMQLINFIRDIAEDCSFGRQYLPSEDLRAHKVASLCIQPQTQSQKKVFSDLITFEIRRYLELQSQAAAGYSHIPYRYRIPIATAAHLYIWTAKKIMANPEIVYQKKVKPSKIRVLLTALHMAWKYRN